MGVCQRRQRWVRQYWSFPDQRLGWRWRDWGKFRFGDVSEEREGLCCLWTANDTGARLYGLEECLNHIHVNIYDLGVTGSKVIRKSTKSGAVVDNNNKEVSHGNECNTIEPAEKLVITTHVVADDFGGSLLERVESGDALGVVVLIMKPHILKPVAFVRGVVEEDAKDFIR